jgi:hypothetical protein
MRDVIDTFDERIRPKLFALADALGMDLKVDKEYATINGTTKRKVDLFEGYSPTICPTIELGRICTSSRVMFSQGQIFGNLGFVCTVEAYGDLVTFMLYDRSKVEGDPQNDAGWSRRKLYKWLGDAVKAVYYRSMFDDEWRLLDKGPARIREYNEARAKQMSAKEAYDIVWEDYQ